MINNTKFKKIFTRVLSMLLVITMVVPMGLDQLYTVFNEQAQINKESEQNDSTAFGWSEGSSTSTGVGGDVSKNGGIISSLYPDCGFSIVVSRDPDLKYYSENGLDPSQNMWNTSNYSFPTDEQSSLFLIAKAVQSSSSWNNYAAGIYSHSGGGSITRQSGPGNVVLRSSDNPGSKSPVPEGVYYNKILEYLKKPGGATELKNNFNSIFTDYNTSLAAWSYITAPKSRNEENIKYDVSNRFDEVFKHNTSLDWKNFEKLEGEEALQMQAMCIDALATLYIISPSTAGCKESFKRAAIDYIDGADLKERPMALKIQPIIALTDNGKREVYILRTMDFMGWFAALQANYRLYTPTWKAFVKTSGKEALRGSFMNQLVEATNKSIGENKLANRQSSIAWKGNDKDSMIKFASYGLNYKYFSSVGGQASWRDKNGASARANMHDIVVYHGDKAVPSLGQASNAMWGMVLVPMARPGNAITAQFGKIEALPDGQVIDSKVLGKPVTVNIYAGIDTEDGKNNWKVIINNVESNSSTFSIDVKITRTNSPYGSKEIGTFHIDGVTPEQMKGFINGGLVGTMLDEVQDYAAPDVAGGADPNVVFDYKADFKVTTNYNNQDYEFTGISEDPASFIVLPERLGYTSKPEAYVELKNYGAGSNMSGTLSEEWEAMAGVPSTEQLYFAAGGSEFIVDITVEYVKDEVAKRSYDAYYTQTKCQFYDGDNSKTHTLGGVTVNTHTGGHYTASGYPKSGTCPYTFSAGSHGSFSESWDCSSYNAAVAAAEAKAAQINETILKFTDASHGDYREHAGWGAHVIKSMTHPGASSGHCIYTSDGKGGSVHSGDVDATPGSTGTWTVTVEFDVPEHILCGPCCEHIIPEVHDTWAQTWKYDSMKIADVHVWQIDQAAVEGLDEIIGPSVDIGGAQGTLAADGIVGADIRQGRPNIFYNIALKKDKDFVKQDGRNGNATGTSAAGRVRYNLAGAWKDAEQHDEVKWNIGVRQNTCDGLSTTHANTVSPTISGKGHNEPKGKGFIYNSFLPTPSTTGAKSRFTSLTTGVGSTGQQDFPVNQVGFLQAHTDAQDKTTTEYKGFLEKREQSMTAWMITDFLILQTSNGDQSVLYYDAKNPSVGKVTAESEIPELDIEKEKMWENNVNSAAKWREDHINVGGYNGKYSQPTQKFKVNNNGNAPQTIFDGREGGGKDPAKTINRPTRPNKNLMLYNGQLNIILADTNKKYETGKSEVFWANILHWTDTSSDRFSVNPSAAPYSTVDKIGDLTKFDFSKHCGIANAGNAHCVPTTDLKAPGFAAKNGYIMEATYSKEHDKINDIIVHDPVSTENVALISLPDERDQRYGDVIGAEYAKNLENKLLVCPGEPGLCDFRILDCTYFEDTKVGDFDFDTLDVNNNPINKLTKNGIVLSSGFSLASAPSGSSKLKGTTLRANGGTRIEIPLSELGVQYTPALKLQAEMDIRLTSMATKQMIASFKGYGLYVDQSGNIGFTTGQGDYRTATNIKIANNTDYHIKAVFSFKQVNSCELYVNGTKAVFSNTGTTAKEFTATSIGYSFNIGSFGTSSEYKLYGYVDNLVLTRLAGTAFHTADCYTTIMSHPSGLNYHEHSAACIDTDTWTKQYNYSTSPQKVVLQPGQYIFEVWGASGGGNKPTAGVTEYEWQCNYVSCCHGSGSIAWSTSNTVDPVPCGGYHHNGSHLTGNTRSTAPGSTGGLGGYSKATYNITVPTTVYVYTGGQGTLSSGLGTGGGAVGGGHGGSGGYGGGGMTYISTVGTDSFSASYKPTTSTVNYPAGQMDGTSTYAARTSGGSWNDSSNTDWTVFKTFKVNSSGTARFWSTSSAASNRDIDPVARLRVNGVVVASDDDGGSGYNFDLSTTVKAGDTISYEVSSYRTGESASIQWHLTHPGLSEVTTVYKWNETNNFNTNGVLLLAGGGGGSDNATSEKSGTADDGSGGDGGGTSGGNAKVNGVAQSGTGGTQSSGYRRGMGQHATTNVDTGGAGAGWWSGKVTNNSQGGAGGGSGYISGKVTNGITTAGKNWGNGYAKITRVAGIEAITDNILNGVYTDQEVKDILGDKIYNQIINNTTGSLIHTWSGWTSSNMMGFVAGGTNTISASGNNLIVNSTGADPIVRVPVDIQASSVRKIVVTLDNPTSSTLAQLFWNGTAGGEAEARSIRTTIKANTSNQTVTFIVNGANGWSGTISQLRFDMGNTTGTQTIKSIALYGTGTKTAGGSSSAQTWTYTSAGSNTVTLPAGTYKLEAWGAQGAGLPSGYSPYTGSTRGVGGKGGYSYGTLTLSSQTTLYAVVGGQGSGNSGGYNGGGSGSKAGGGGGGATHIATASGTLSGLNSNRSSILIVAGGGGGAQYGDGGYGGGGNNSGETSPKTVGGSAVSSFWGGQGTGGTNTAGYAFGQGGPGQAGSDNLYGGAGGGGWFGGYGATSDVSRVDDHGGAGGSGYINTSRLTSYGGTNNSKTGAGKILITSMFTPVKITGNDTSKLDKNSIINAIKNNWQDIPYWKGNQEGVKNPIWKCDYLPLNVHRCDHKCHEELVLRCGEPHHQNMHYDGSNTICWKACNNDEQHKKFKNEINTVDGKFTPGNFINLDWGFEIYFPNIGDFEQGQVYGLGQLTTTRGKNFRNDMDTSKWTRVKRVRFNVNVIRNGVLYLSGEWITLADRGEYTGKDGSKYSETKWTNYGTELFDAIQGDRINGRRNGIYQFYCVEANEEIAASDVRVEVEAVNCPGSNDNTTDTTNRKRMTSFKSLHGGTNVFYMDVVGRIGNLVLEDTGDYRFSNLFKQTVEAEKNEEPTVYRVSNNGLSEIGGAILNGNRIDSDIAGAGAQVTSITLPEGQYKLTVKGEELNNGNIKIITQSGWNVIGEYDTTSGIVVTEEELEMPEGTTGGSAGSDVTVQGPGIEMEPGKYRLELFGQGFLNTDFKLRIYNPKTDVYSDITGDCEHVGKTNEKATMIIDLPDGIELGTTSGGLEIYCTTTNNNAFIFDRLVVKRLDTSSVKNIATTDSVTRVTISTSIMSYYVNIASDTPAEISYIATNSGGMSVESISVQRLGDYDDSWIVEGIVKKVDESKQNEYFSWGINDIRGVSVSEDTQWLNTYSTQNWMNRAPIRLPLSPSKNNIAILRDEPMLVGYDLYMAISTLGGYIDNDRSFLQVIPYYYVIDLDQKNVQPIPVDAYLKYSKGYYPVNIFGLVTGQNKNVAGASEEYKNMTIDDVYNFTANLDWINENARRNYTEVERYQTETLSNMLVEYIGSIERNLFIPVGHSYNMGNSQFIQINGKARTFIGGETTYSELMNLGGANHITVDDTGRKFNEQGRITNNVWWRFGQRWHFTLGVPSSTVFVRQGVTPDSDTIEEFKKANYVVLCCADIRALGDTWQLRYSHGDKSTYGHTNGEKTPADNGTIQVTTRDGTLITYPIPDELPPAIAVYSTVKSSEFDVSIVGIH